MSLRYAKYQKEGGDGLVNEIPVTCHKNGTLILLQCSILSQFRMLMLHKIYDTTFYLACKTATRHNYDWHPPLIGESAIRQSDQGFSPRAMRPEISAWNAGGPKANQSSPI